MSLPALETGDILAVQGTGFLAWLVRRATGSPWTHVALFVGDGQIAEISPEHQARVVPMRYRRYKAFRLRGGLVPSQQAAIIAWLRGRIGSRYDWAAVAGIALRGLFGGLGACLNSRRRYICTELVIEAYRAAGIDLDPTCRPVTPAELMASEALQLVHQEVA